MAKTITVVPPVLLVRMFGVPESVTLPAKVGAETTFVAYGKTWRIARLASDTWCLSVPLCSPRVRFGTAKEIADDVGSVLETGQMPGQPGRP